MRCVMVGETLAEMRVYRACRIHDDAVIVWRADE